MAMTTASSLSSVSGWVSASSYAPLRDSVLSRTDASHSVKASKD